MLRTSLLALRSLRGHPIRTLLTTFGIVLGVAVILAVSITNRSTLDSIKTLFNETSGKAQLVVNSASTDEAGFSSDALRRIANVPGLETAVPSVHAQTFLVGDLPPAQMGVNFFGAAAGGLALYGIDAAVDREAREYKIVAGEFLHVGVDSYDVVLVKDYADEKKLQVGRDIEILSPHGVERLRIVGLMSKEGPGQLNNGMFGVIPLKAAQAIFDRGSDIDQIDIVATPQAASGAALSTLQANLQDRLGDRYVVVYPAAQGERVTQMLNTYQFSLAFFSVMALFVGAFLIYNAFSMTVVERTREIGMLRTVGMTRRQIMYQILTEAFALGSIGSALGVGAGFLLSVGLIRVSERFLGQAVRRVDLPLDGLVLSVLVGVVTTILAAIIPAWQAGRISPLEALRIRGNPRQSWIVQRGWTVGSALLVVSYVNLYYSPFPPSLSFDIGRFAVFTMFLGATLLIAGTVDAWERIARPWFARIYGSEGQLGSRNTRRAKLRTTLTVAALMVGLAMILGVRGMTSSFEHDIQSWIDVYIGGDLYVHSTIPMRADLGRRFEALDGVAVATPIRYFDVKWLKPDGSDETLTFMAVDPASYRQVTSFVFSAGQGDPDALLDQMAAGDTVFVASTLSEKYGLKRGDTVRLATRRGEHDFRVAAVVIDYNNQGMVVEGSWKDMRRYFDLNDVSAFMLKTAPGVAPGVVQERVDQLYGKARHLTVDSNKALKAQASSLMAQIFGLFDVLALISMVVASLGVVNTLTMNVLERTQEIGMLRSLGMTRRQVGKMILAEAGLMGVIGGTFGLVFGLFLSRVFLMAAATMQGYDLAYVLPVQGILVSVLIALVISQLAAVWPARRAAGIRILEAIHFE